jgi:hypothetical protein
VADNLTVGVLRAILTADTAQFEEGMRKGSSAAKKFGDDSTNVGKQLEQAFDVAKIAGGLTAFTTAIFGVTKAMQGWVQSTSEQEDATARLSAALRAQGTFTPQVAKQYDDLASAYERTTVFSDELLMGMEALLVQVGGVMPQDMKAALGAVTDLAAGLRIDLNTATMLVAKALEGNVGALHRYGINVDEAKLKTQGATAVFDAIAEKMGGQAAAQAETFSGQMARLGNIVDNVKETLGGFIAGALKPLVDGFVAIPEPIRTTMVAAGLLGAAAAATAVAIGGLTVATSTLLPILGVELPAAATASTVALTALAATGGLITGAIGLILTPIGLAVAAFATLTAGLLYVKSAITTDFGPAIEQATAGINKWREATVKASQVKLPLDPNDLKAVRKAEDDLTESAKASIEAHQKAADAAKKHRDEIQKLAETYFGLDKIKDVTKTLEALAGSNFMMGTPKQVQALHDAIQEASDAAQRMGLEIPNAWAQIWDATGKANDGLQEYLKTLKDVKAVQDGLRLPELGSSSSVFTNLPGLRADPTGVRNGTKDDLKGPPGFLQSVFGGGAGIGGAFARAFEGGGGLSGGIQSIATTVLGKALNFIPAIGPIISQFAGPLVAGVKKLFGGLFGGEGRKTNNDRDASVTKFTGIGDLQGAQEQLKKMAAEAGVTDTQIRKLFDTKNPKEFEAAFADVTGKIQEQQALVQKYNLNWTNFSGPKRADEFSKALKEVTADTEGLERAGLSHEEALKKTADGYVELAKQGIAAGEGIEPALAPVLKQLADMGLLTDDMVKSLQGVADDGLPTWQEMEQAAEKYGLKIDGMGARYQQLRITDEANGILKDFNLLIQGGVPLSSLLGEMSDEVNDFIHRAITMGTEVPDSMRGMLQSFVDQGDLTDASGQKLKDLSQIKFAEPIQDAIHDLIDTLNTLIGTIGNVGSAFADLPGTVPSAPDITQPSFDNAINMAGGGSGVVNSSTLFRVGEAGPEEFSFSGAGRKLKSGGADPETRAHQRRLERFMRDQPRMLGREIADALAGV